VTVDDSGKASVNIDFSSAFTALGLADALLDVRSIRVVPYRDGTPGEAIPYEETYSTLLIDGESLIMDPASGEPYWTEEDLFTLEYDDGRATQGTGSIHAHFEYRENGCSEPGFNYDFNNIIGEDWSDDEVLIYDVLPEVNDSAVDQSPDLFFFKLEGLENCPMDSVNGPALVMDVWNPVSVSLRPFGSRVSPDASNLKNIHFFIKLKLKNHNIGFYGEGDELDLWLDNFRLVDQDGEGEIRWEADADVDKYYIYFDTLNHEGHPLPQLASIGEATVNAVVGEAEAGGYFHKISGSDTDDLSIWTAPIEEKILRSAKAPVSSQPLKVYAARGEMEAFQIIVHSPQSRAMPVSISDLTGESGVIDASQVELFRVDYINVEDLSDFYGRIGPYPDPLYPVNFGELINFPAGENQPVWFRVRVPMGTQPGVYEGSIAVGSATIPVSLEVWDFLLPQRNDFDVYFEFDWDNVMEAYGGTNGGEKAECYDVVKQTMDDTLRDYRITALPLGFGAPKGALYSLTNYEVEAAHAQQLQSSIGALWGFNAYDQPPFPNPAVIDRSGLDARVLPWMAWLNRVGGTFYSQLTDWDPDPWDEVYSNYLSNGDGFFFYPPKDDTLGFDACDPKSSRLVPSIRLELFREGLEDYAYLLLLTGHTPEIGVGNQGDALARTFVYSRTAFNRVPTVISNLRMQMAELLKGKGNNTYFIPLIVQ
jgi:hypothetical protein